MIFHKDIAGEIADKLLQIQAIKLNVQQPFDWASGWKSPIYCDNRKTLSYPRVRTYLKNIFSQLIEEHFASAEVIAGVATAGIPHGALIADKLDLPFIYVRSSSKGHGLQNQIEGDYRAGQKVVVIEDLISTGNSSLEAVEVLRNQKMEVTGLAAIFTYGFKVAEENFSRAACPYLVLSDYSHLIEKALEKEMITNEMIDTLEEWRKNPSQWGK